MRLVVMNWAIYSEGGETFALSIEPQNVPTVHVPGANIRVPLGNFGDVRSPLCPPNDVSLIDISLDDGADLSVPISAGHSAFIMPIFGEIEIDGRSFGANELQLPVVSEQATSHEFTLKAKHGATKVVVFSGMPLHQPVHWHGSLAMASVDILNARLAAYKRGEFGSI